MIHEYGNKQIIRATKSWPGIFPQLIIGKMPANFRAFP